MTRRLSLKTILRGGTAVFALTVAFTVLPAGPAQAADPERCSGPIAVTPDRLDTMRVCVRWNSSRVTGFIRYYPSTIIGPERYSEFDFSVQLYRGQSAYGTVRFVKLVPPFLLLGPSFDIEGNPQPNIGGADGGQTYFARGTVAVNQQQSTGVTGQSPNVTT